MIRRELKKLPALLGKAEEVRTAEIDDYVRARIAPKLDAVAPGEIGPKHDGPLEQLEKLGALHSAQVLTTEEFEAKKTEVLARM